MQIEMTIKGVMVDAVTNDPIIILRDHDGQRVLPIWVGVPEANAIGLQIENVAPQRPLTHDLLRDVITCYALIHLRVREELVAIDARPSDAIALALRARAPIFVEESVMENARTIESAPDRTNTQRLQRWLESLDADDLGKYKM